jgi:hypothetical protein
MDKFETIMGRAERKNADKDMVFLIRIPNWHII